MLHRNSCTPTRVSLCAWVALSPHVLDPLAWPRGGTARSRGPWCKHRWTRRTGPEGPDPPPLVRRGRDAFGLVDPAWLVGGAADVVGTDGRHGSARGDGRPPDRLPRGDADLFGRLGGLARPAAAERDRERRSTRDDRRPCQLRSLIEPAWSPCSVSRCSVSRCSAWLRSTSGVSPPRARNLTTALRNCAPRCSARSHRRDSVGATFAGTQRWGTGRTRFGSQGAAARGRQRGSRDGGRAERAQRRKETWSIGTWSW